MLMDLSTLHQKMSKPNPSEEEMEEIVRGLRNGCYNIPDASFEYSYKLLKKNSSSDQKLVNVDELIHSGMEMRVPSPALKQYLQWFMEKLGKNRYIQKLTSLINYSTTEERSIQQFDSVIKEDYSDYESRKRMLSYYKKNGKMDEYIRKINELLEDNPSDQEAWLELSQAYTERGQYMRAVFCFEELIMLCQENDHYTVRMGQLYYTLGGKSNIDNAIKYFSCVVAKSPKNYRALWNLHKALEAIDSEEYAELRQKTADTLKKFYRQGGLGIKINTAL